MNSGSSVLFARLATAAAAPQDSVVVQSPLPGGVASVVRFLFQVPQWIQVGGAVLGALLLLTTAIVLWRRRMDLWAWLLGRSPRALRAFVLLAGLLVATAGVMGSVSWNYMQHDNDFCIGCHVMGSAFERFRASEHDSLNCHDCHQQPLMASARQLYLWILERPEAIGPHAPVANDVCAACHVTGEPEVWQRIAETAGHRTHLESDSTDLDDVMCVTCHGLEVHRFVPVDSTCAQSDCHVDVDITIGAMQNQSALHCATCHEFTAEVPLLAERDSAAATLIPALDECLSCHEMQEALADFDPDLDPHNATCGSCHNPHEQAEAEDAQSSCATAGCHADWRNEPFHTGPAHTRTAQQCQTCHEPHRAKVDASDCVGCHEVVADKPDTPDEIRLRLRRALPFDTAAALRDTLASLRGSPQIDLLAWAPPGGVGVVGHWGVGVGVSDWQEVAEPMLESMVQQADTFSHDEHADLSCLTCHETATGHGNLTFEVPRGCQICHHQNPAAAECATCHRADDLAVPVRVSLEVTTAGYPTHARNADFEHVAHDSIVCIDCHVRPVTLDAVETVTTCVDCHENHHDADRECASCHVGSDYYEVHGPPVQAHTGCDVCHQPATITGLHPDRSFCATCHEPEREHYPERECTVCHMQAIPDAFRGRLMRSGMDS